MLEGFLRGKSFGFDFVSEKGQAEATSCCHSSWNLDAKSSVISFLSSSDVGFRSFELENGSFGRGKHHDPHDAFCVHAFIFLRYPYFTFETGGNSDNHRCRTGVNAHLVGYLQGKFRRILSVFFARLAHLNQIRVRNYGKDKGKVIERNQRHSPAAPAAAISSATTPSPPESFCSRLMPIGLSTSKKRKRTKPRASVRRLGRIESGRKFKGVPIKTKGWATNSSKITSCGSSFARMRSAWPQMGMESKASKTKLQ